MRDRALLLIGFSGTLRRSELVGLDVDDGLRLVLQRFKTDQEGETRRWPAYGTNPATCPVRAW